MAQQKSSRYNLAVILILSCAYYFYMAFVAQMVIVQDSINFEYLGRMVADQGWHRYFETGPNREPVYVGLIAFSMWCEKIFDVPYQDIMKFSQAIILLITQLMLYWLLCRARVKPIIRLSIVAFFAIAPDITNSMLTLYCEVATYPLVIGIILFTEKAWNQLQEEKNRDFIKTTIILAICYSFMTLSKAIFEYILPFYLIPFFVLLFLARNNKGKFRKIIQFLFIFFLCFIPIVTGFKLMNFTGNGAFAITNRGQFMLYGNAAHRTSNPVNGEKLLVGFLSSVGGSEQKICPAVLNPETCKFWDFRNADQLATKKMDDFHAKHFTPEQMNNAYKIESVKMILRHPISYFTYASLEALTMIFWKTAEISFAAYPNWFMSIINIAWFKYLLSFLTAGLTFLSFIYCAILTIQCRKESLTNNREISIIFWILVLIFPYLFWHSLAAVQTRYCLPIVPLYLTMIGIFLSNICQWTKKCR